MQQPKPISRNYTKLVENIENGIYQIPKFQRDFVWNQKKSANLLDSLLKGYPIGSFILWKTKDKLNSIKRLGGNIFKKTKESDDVFYILDGQQRITSLYLALKGISIEKNNYREIYIDLEKDIEGDEEICTIEKPQNSISFYDMMNKDILDISEEYSKNIAKKVSELKKHIETYEFSTIEIENQPLEKIVDVFTRINTSGKVLTLFEIMNAKIYTEAKNGKEGFDLEEKFNLFREELKKLIMILLQKIKKLFYNLLLWF